jgi:replication factor C subunit 1
LSILFSHAAHELGYDVIEMNASDARNKSSVEGVLKGAVMSQAMDRNVRNTKKRLVIMDEVDGMGGSDRGTASA